MKKFTVYSQDPKYYQKQGWKHSARYQSNNIEINVEGFNKTGFKFKIIDNNTKEIIATNA